MPRRLLTISTDILEGVPVVFDSYLLRSDVKVEGDIIYTVDYGDGIQPDHVIASASVPINYAYKVIEDTKGNEHYLWDGGLLSNTPLTELLQAHHYYYYENKVEEMAGPGTENWKNLIIHQVSADSHPIPTPPPIAIIHSVCANGNSHIPFPCALP